MSRSSSAARRSSRSSRTAARRKPTAASIGRGKHGTRTRFVPDSEIFDDVDFNWETIATRLRESAYLNKGLWIRLVDERADREKNFLFQGGVTSASSAT